MADLRPWLALTALLVSVVVAPFVLFEDAIGAALDAFHQSGPSAGAVAAVVIGALALDVVLPVPSTVVTTLAGGLLGAGVGTAAAWLGMSLGCAGAFWLGQRGGRALSGRLLSSAELARAERTARRFGAWAVIVLRPVPVLAEVSVIYAGMVGMPWRQFLWCTSLANLGIAAVYAGVGAWAAHAELFALAALASIALPGAALLVARRSQRAHTKRAPTRRLRAMSHTHMSTPVGGVEWSGEVEPLALPVADGLVLRGDGRGDPNGPLVVLLHGGGQTRQAWTETAEALARAGFRALALDLRGHGESDWDPAARYDFPHYAADTEALLRGLPRPAVLVGASLGGIASLMAAGFGPQERCTGLVLVDVAPHIEPQGAERVLRFMGARPDGFASLEEVAAAVAAYNPHRQRPPDLRNLEKNLRRRADGRWVWHWDPKFLEVDRSDRGRTELMERAARAVRAPTLLVRGRQSDLLSEEGARRFLALVPHARFSDVSGAGHMVAGDRNDAFTEAVLQFLAEIV